MPETAGAMAKLYLAVIWHCNGKRWPKMFAAMAGGRASATTGVAVAATEMGFLLPCTIVQPAARIAQRTKKPAAPQAPAVAKAGVTAVELGATGVRYTVADDLGEPTAVVQFILDTATSCRLQWPQAHGDVVPFAEAAITFAKKVRSFRTEAGAGLHGGREPKGGYLVRHFVRVLLATVDTTSPMVLHGMQMDELAPFLPDQGEHVLIVGKMSVAEMRIAFDVPVTMVSMWACLARTAADDTRLTAALSADMAGVTRLFRTSPDLRPRAEDACVVGPRALMDAWSDAGLM